MTQPKITIGNHPTIEEDMIALQEHIVSYRNAINQEGIWLFLATLGCWGVSQLAFQYCAYLLAILLFGERMKNRISETKSFSELAQRIEQRIKDTMPDGDSRKARLYDLAEFQKAELSKLKSLLKAKVFLLCWAFYGASFLYLVFSKL